MRGETVKNADYLMRLAAERGLGIHFSTQKHMAGLPWITLFVRRGPTLAEFSSISQAIQWFPQKDTA